jgi:hypothetical protein
MAGRRLILACLAAGLVAVLVVPAGAKLRPNPADDPRLAALPIEALAYDYAERCRKRPTRGARSLSRWLDRNVRGESWGIVRCEKLGRGLSVHSEGRAIDWRLDAGIRKERRAARRLIRTLLATDANGEPFALARRMGVQGLIFNCRDWFAGSPAWGRYEYCYGRNGERRRKLDRTQAHMDHIHIELNWAGARKRTSFWQSGVSRR